MESKTLKHIIIIDMNKNMRKGIKNFINVEGRVSPNAVRSHVTHPASVQPSPHQKHTNPAT